MSIVPSPMVNRSRRVSGRIGEKTREGGYCAMLGGKMGKGTHRELQYGGKVCGTRGRRVPYHKWKEKR